MDEAYIGTVLLFGGNFAPRGWAFCDGQLLSINQNQALFSILGTTYGGDGRNTFGLPDLRGRAALHAGQGPGLTTRQLGEKSGTETITLTTNELPAHSHIASGAIMAKEEADIDDPTAHYVAGTGNAIFGTSSDIAMNANSVDVQVENNGGGQAHYNMQPYLCLNYIICTQGLFPPRS